MSNNSIDEFFSRVPGSKTDLKSMENFISNQGDFTQIKNIDVILRSLMNLIMTVKGTYLFDPEYGTNIVKYIFEPVDEITKDSILQDISASVSRYEGRSSSTFDIKFLKGDIKGFVLDVNVSYQGEKKEISIRVDESLLKSIGV